MASRGTLLLRSSFRLASRRFGQRQYVRSLPQLSHATCRHKHQLSVDHKPVRTGFLGLIKARFSSESGEKCPDHKVQNCKKCAKEVSLDELTTLMEDFENLRLVDVRESYELREAGRIPHAINIPLTQLKGALKLEDELFQEKIGSSKPTKADSIVFFGMGSIRSVAALEIAYKMGYKKARHYPGGWLEWNEKMEQGTV